MFRALVVTALIGTAWATSHYLTKASHDFGTAKHAFEAMAPAQSAGTRTVALLDFAVAALPKPGAAKSEPAVTPDTGADTAALAAPDAVTLPDAEPIDKATEARLARRLQQELRRVGCLKARADGVWGPSSRRAMQSFADRINATLPTDRPDTVLLMLVERYEDRACGAPCRAGAQPDARGRCQPREEIARRPSEPVRTASLAESTAVATGEAEAPSLAETATLAPSSTASLRPVRTKIGRAARNKAPPSVRVKSRKTIWSVPAYGLGMSQPKAQKTVNRKRKRAGSAAYRRWMVRSGVTMR